MRFWGDQQPGGRECDTPIGELSAYQAGGNTSLDALETSLQAARARRGDTHLWLQGPAAQAAELAAWIVRFCQAAGDALFNETMNLNAENRERLPGVTVRQALAYYAVVEGWSSRADEAITGGDDYQLGVRLPAAPWVWQEPPDYPLLHIDGSVAALDVLEPLSSGRLSDLANGTPPIPREFDGAIERIEQEVLRSQAAMRRAAALWSTRAEGVQLHQDVMRSVREAMDTFIQVGQLAAMPSLIDRRYQLRARPKSGPRAPQRPATAGASQLIPPPPPKRVRLPPDQWCLTDPNAKTVHEADEVSVSDLKNLWLRDDDWQKTVAAQGEIDAAAAAGALRRRSGSGLGRCPWQSSWETVREVTLVGVSLAVGDIFAFYVGPLEVGYRREIVKIGRAEPKPEPATPARFRHREDGGGPAPAPSPPRPASTAPGSTTPAPARSTTPERFRHHEQAPSTTPERFRHREDRRAAPRDAGPHPVQPARPPQPVQSARPAQPARSAPPTRPAPPKYPPPDNPWVLTDRATRRRYNGDPDREAALKRFWEQDPDSATTLRIQAEIDRARSRKQIRRTGRTSGEAPWGAIYLVRGPLVVRGVGLKAGDFFTFHAAPVPGGFDRRIVQVGHTEKLHELLGFRRILGRR